MEIALSLVARKAMPGRARARRPSELAECVSEFPVFFRPLLFCGRAEWKNLTFLLRPYRSAADGWCAVSRENELCVRNSPRSSADFNTLVDNVV
jgi:hypothetical protein